MSSLKSSYLITCLFIIVVAFFCGLYYEKQDTDISICRESGETITEPVLIPVDVSGAVSNPGVYFLSSSGLLLDALKAAGGFSIEADKEWIQKNINLSEIVLPNTKVYFPSIQEGKQAVATTKKETDDVEPSKNIPSFVNVNTATLEELDTLNGIGESYANKIILNRPYKDINDFENKSGLNLSVISKIKDKITFL